MPPGDRCGTPWLARASTRREAMDGPRLNIFDCDSNLLSQTESGLSPSETNQLNVHPQGTVPAGRLYLPETGVGYPGWLVRLRLTISDRDSNLLSHTHTAETGSSETHSSEQTLGPSRLS